MADPICPICKRQSLLTPTETSRGVCDQCVGAFGVWLIPPDLRPHVPCARCNHTQFVSATLRERSHTGGDMGSTFLSPLAVSFEVANEGIWRVRERVQPHRPLGALIAYVCRQCGFTELYTTDAAQIPISAKFGTRLIDVSPPVSEGPFR